MVKRLTGQNETLIAERDELSEKCRIYCKKNFKMQKSFTLPWKPNPIHPGSLKQQNHERILLGNCYIFIIQASIMILGSYPRE